MHPCFFKWHYSFLFYVWVIFRGTYLIYIYLYIYTIYIYYYLTHTYLTNTPSFTMSVAPCHCLVFSFNSGDKSLLYHSSMDGHLGCSKVLAIGHFAAMNTGVHTSFWIIVLSTGWNIFKLHFILTYYRLSLNEFQNIASFYFVL